MSENQLCAECKIEKPMVMLLVEPFDYLCKECLLMELYMEDASPELTEHTCQFYTVHIKE